MTDTRQPSRIQVEIPSEMQGAIEALTKQEKPAVAAEKLLMSPRYRETFERALAYELVGGHLAFEPFVAAVVADVAKNPTLGDAIRSSPGTFLSVLQHCAQWKLLPGSMHGQFYLIPRKNHGVLEVTGMVGYRGLCQVSQRHPRVHSIEATLVYEGEDFDYDAGAGKLRHKPRLDADHSESKILGGYMRAIITSAKDFNPVIDAPIFYLMTRADILKRRAVSESYKRGNSPWHQWPEMMFRKTVLIGGVNHGSVPRDLGVGGLLAAEAESDRILEADEPKLPAPSRGAEVRLAMGLDKPQEPFALAEEAVAAIHGATEIAALEALAGRWQHFHGEDAGLIARAYEERTMVLGGGEP